MAPPAVGTILAVTPAGSLTVRAAGADVPPEGTPVREPRTHLRGVVVRLFGPVAQPYLSVRPRRPISPAEAVRLVGATVGIDRGNEP